MIMITLTKSMTTSLLHSERHSAATLQTCITASGLSALTWKIGALTTLATSVQYGDERDERGSVVKPICTCVTNMSHGTEMPTCKVLKKGDKAPK